MTRRWSTRQDVWNGIDAEHHFVIDLCADEDNAKCAKWFSRSESLGENWSGAGAGWLNPPYGREIGAWLRKASEAERYIVALVPTRTNAPWWHDIVLARASKIRYARRKLPFVEPNGHKGVPFTGHALVIFDPCGLKGEPDSESWDWRDSLLTEGHTR